jgi:hypothetical protein
MKTFFTLLVISFSLTAHAHHSDNHEMPTFEACENVFLAILNRDNLPYWAPFPQAGNVSKCYEDVRIFSQRATPKMINTFVEEYQGQIQIFDNNVDFANFIQANEPDFNPSAQVTPTSFESQISVITPIQPGQLFDGLLQ